MSAFEIVDAQIQFGFEEFCSKMNIDPQSHWARYTFAMTSAQILHDEPFDDSLTQHLFMIRIEHFRTLALANIIYNMFFRK